MMSTSHLMNNNNQVSNDNEDDFPVCQAPSINHNSSNDASPTPPTMGMIFGGMGQPLPKTGGLMGMGRPLTNTSQPLPFPSIPFPSIPFPSNPMASPRTMGMGGPFTNTSQSLPIPSRTMGMAGLSQPPSFGGCCGPPRTMGPMAQMTMGPMAQMTMGPMGLGHRNPPNYQEFQSQQNISIINNIYGKLMEARNKIAELNKVIDEIYVTILKIQ